ncbi:hypothetical protein [Pseudoalteromonas sp. B530]|uniref:hypothetical protein n=1 Tax=Pseudoalteromonas sp. B530 TaxID=2994390 RepID=UPI00224B653B|nr:hypothetical protein [Pseudoalteromonas sp. B530]MCX2769543.1 hypothetical protein [Pseudoalteromonas sp. B530]
MNTRSIAQPLKAKSKQPTTKATPLLGLTGYTSRLPVAWLVLASFIFLAALSIYVIANYYDTRRDIMARIDAQLINAATSANVIVGKKYHESPEQITPAEFKQKKPCPHRACPCFKC